MREIHPAVDREAAALSQAPGRRGKIAEPVDGDRHGPVVRRNEEGRGEMAEMVFDRVGRAAEFVLGEVALKVARDVGPLAAIAKPAEDVPQAHP